MTFYVYFPVVSLNRRDEAVIVGDQGWGWRMDMRFLVDAEFAHGFDVNSPYDR